MRQRGADAEARTGEVNQFDVVTDGRLVFSREREGRWVDADEILARL